jgi:hypothetical protein
MCEPMNTQGMNASGSALQTAGLAGGLSTRAARRSGGDSSPFTAPANPSLDGLSRWQRQRVQFLHLVCIWIEARVQRGDTVCRAVRRFSARHHGRRFRASRRALHLSPSRLRTLFYHWCKLRSPVVFIPGYRLDAPARVRVPRALPLAELVNAGLAPGVVSLAAAYRALRSQAADGAAFPGYARFWERLPRRQRKAIHELHRVRRAQGRARLREQQIVSQLQRQADALVARQTKGSAS